MITLEELEKRVKALEERERRIDELEGMEKRLKALEDLEEIKKLHRDYIFWLSNHQWDEMIDCFSEDAIAWIGKHGEQKGKKAIKASFDSDISQVAAYQKGGQILVQPVIAVDGDKASGYWSWYRLNTDFKSPSGQTVKLFGPKMQAKYDCEYIKENGKWKIKSIRLKLDTEKK